MQAHVTEDDDEVPGEQSQQGPTDVLEHAPELTGLRNDHAMGWPASSPAAWELEMGRKVG